MLHATGWSKEIVNCNMSLTYWTPFLFPKNYESQKFLDIQLREVKAKIPLKGTSKVNRQTDKQTDKNMDISTYRKHRPRGPMLWKLLLINKKVIPALNKNSIYMHMYIYVLSFSGPFVFVLVVLVLPSVKVLCKEEGTIMNFRMYTYIILYFTSPRC